MKTKKFLIPITGVAILAVLILRPNTSTIPTLLKMEQNTTAPQLVSKNFDTFERTRQWHPVNDSSKPIQRLPKAIQVAHIKTQRDAFDHLQNGEKITLYIPQDNQSYIGTVEKNHQQFGGQVQVSTGSIEDGAPLSSFTVTKGPELTLVMVATGEKIYQIEINNKTGAGTVIDDQSLDYFRKHDDGQTTPPEGIS